MMNLLGQKWDCFVFLGVPFNNVPSQQKTKILHAVTEGAGIVFVGTDGGDVLKKDYRLVSMPPILTGQFSGEAYTVGRGRGVLISKKPDIEYHEGWEVEYDHRQELLGRAVIWAAGKEPSIQINFTHLPAPASTNARELAAHFTLGHLPLKVLGKPAGQNLKLMVSLSKPGNEPIVLPLLPLSSLNDVRAGEALDIPVPKLPKGIWHVDARLMSSAGVETWATSPFEVHSDLSISELKLNRGWGEPGGLISGTVSVSGRKLQKEVLRIQLLDRRRREWSERISLSQAGLPGLNSPSRNGCRCLSPWKPGFLPRAGKLTGHINTFI